MTKQIIAKVISQREVKRGCFRMSLEAPFIAKSAKPGQFLHIRCGNSLDPLLRRPISIHGAGKKNVDILYNVVGRGTEILSKKKKGDKIDIIGPLGNGFKIYENSKSLKMLVAGGMGVAPLLGLAQVFRRNKKKRFIVVLGAKSQNHILCERQFKNLGGEVYTATEDGSHGKRATATELSRQIIKSEKNRGEDICVYAAGPIGMIKSLCRLAGGCSMKSQASLEERMACGLGACLGCVIDTQSGYKRVCKDGPVFDFCELVT